MAPSTYVILSQIFGRCDFKKTSLATLITSSFPLYTLQSRKKSAHNVFSKAISKSTPPIYSYKLNSHFIFIKKKTIKELMRNGNKMIVKYLKLFAQQKTIL
jgi:hypothetical protein